MKQVQILGISGNGYRTSDGVKAAIGNAQHNIGSFAWCNGDYLLGGQRFSSRVSYVPENNEGIIEIVYNVESGTKEYQLRSIKNSMPVLIKSALPDNCVGKLVYGVNKFAFVNLFNNGYNATDTGKVDIITYQNGNKTSYTLSWYYEGYENKYLDHFNIYYNENEDLCLDVYLESYVEDGDNLSAKYIYKESHYINNGLDSIADNSIDFTERIRSEVNNYKTYVEQDIQQKLSLYTETPGLDLEHYGTTTLANNPDVTVRIDYFFTPIEVTVNPIIHFDTVSKNVVLSMLTNITTREYRGLSEDVPDGEWIDIGECYFTNNVNFYLRVLTYTSTGGGWGFGYMYQVCRINLDYQSIVKLLKDGGKEALYDSNAVRGNFILDRVDRISEYGSYSMTSYDSLGMWREPTGAIPNGYLITWNSGGYTGNNSITDSVNYDPIEYSLAEGFKISTQKQEDGSEDKITLIQSEWSLDVSEQLYRSLWTGQLPLVTQKGDTIILYDKNSLYKINKETKETTLIADQQISNYQFPVIKMSKAKFRNLFKIVSQ